MKNKIILLIAFLAIASCSSNEQVVTEVAPEPVVQQAPEPIPAPAPEPMPEPVVEAPKEEPIAIYSVPQSEIDKSEIKPFVVYFDTDKYNIRDDAALVLNEKVLPEAKNTKTKRIVIEAHCDERGSLAYNQRLSENRAKAVKKFLVANGIKAATIKTVGYGETKPVAEGHSEEFWSQNRRAVTIVIKR